MLQKKNKIGEKNELEDYLQLMMTNCVWSQREKWAEGGLTHYTTDPTAPLQGEKKLRDSLNTSKISS
jgi:hypothetical protein